MSPEESPLRLFFAVPVAPELVPAVTAVQECMGSAGADLRWVEAHNLHFTLKFLGDTPSRVAPRLAEVAAQVAARHRRFDLHIAGAGAFPRPQAPRVVWLGCREGATALVALAADLDSALIAANLAEAEDRPFRAHLTIGRAAGRGDSRADASAIEQCAEVEIGAMSVERFALVRSRLAPSGPQYTHLEQFELD